MRRIYVLWVFVKHMWLVSPSLFTDPFDFAERWLKVEYFNPPQWLFWVLLVAGISVAIYLTYRELNKSHSVAWEVYDNLSKAFRDLTYATDEKQRAEIHAHIEEERGKLPDRELDTMINLFLNAEAERARFGLSPYSDDAQYVLSLHNERMRNYLSMKYGSREYGRADNALS
ncbi:MAG: hypothetical protein HYX84_07825 [Chloroflexi bacterium]|nr:hypothetical protein [Chloroflexota bacterium]